MSGRSGLKRLLSGLTAIMLCAATFTAVPVSRASAETYELPTISYTKQKTYSEYFDEISSAARPSGETYMTYSSSADGAEVEVGQYPADGAEKKDAVIWRNEEGSVTYTVDVPQAGAYNIEMCYYPVLAGNTVSEVSLLIDGESPYDTATRISIPRRWRSRNEIKQNERGNETRPPQIEDPDWITTTLKDSDGLFNEPLYFELSAGTHEITFSSERAAIAINYVKLCQYEPAQAYTSPSASELAKNAGVSSIKVQGENFAYSNSQMLFPTYDRGNYLTEDHLGESTDPVKERYNTVGNDTWNKQEQMVTWKIDVPADGWYKVGIKARQDDMRGFYSNRRLYIDGEVPSAPFDQIKFYYDPEWQMTSPTDDSGAPAYMYLTQGEHELSLEAIPGEIGESMRVLDGIVYEANQYYLKILMITGPNPDRYTDYYVQKEIPELIPAFQRLSDSLKAEQAKIEGLSNSSGSEATTLARFAEVLDRCIKKPNKIQNFISNSSIKDNIAALSAWMKQYRMQPLEVDFIELCPADKEFTPVKENFFKAIGYSVKGFVGSFFEDYTVLSDSSKDSIMVWVTLGRDQATVVKELTDSEFNTTHDTQVSINLVQGTIMEAVLAGKGPDVAMFVGGEFPVNLAIRDLLVPLDSMDGFDEVTSRFQDKALVHYQFDGRTFGIPLARDFPMMFYRTDTLAELGIEHPPETWDDLIDMLPAFQRKYLQPGLILPASLGVAPSTEAGHTYAMLMLQSGITYYNDEQTATTFDSVEAVEAFDKWTQFYTTYQFDQVYDAFTRFRTGEAPIVIQNYNAFYNQLEVAAPEISGAWDFCPVPGTRRADGTVSHAANSGGSGIIVMKDCKNVEGAWEYIKWFTSDDVMVEYGQNVEGVMGPLGRFSTANVNALQKLNWSKTDLEKINAQVNELDEIPITPSSYVVTRSVMNAFRSVVNENQNAREQLRWYNRDINAEISRKRKNLGLDE
ncbi:MAG: extracellular solute-binding protein [Oscillospiraceae bacterium]|nr:extracellular solute-binding protein [Oscillospiraceae bacterium]